MIRVGIFWRPALLTVLLHGLLLYAITVNWSAPTDAAVKPVQTPRFIQARLVEIAPPKKATRWPRTTWAWPTVIWENTTGPLNSTGSPSLSTEKSVTVEEKLVL